MVICNPIKTRIFTSEVEKTRENSALRSLENVGQKGVIYHS